MSDGSKRPPGRPRKHPVDARRKTVTFRVRDEVYDRFAETAAAKGRSVSEEIESQLEQLHAESTAYGEIPRLIGEVMRATESQMGRRWFADEDARKETRTAIDVVLNSFVAKPVNFEMLEKLAKGLAEKPTPNLLMRPLPPEQEAENEVKRLGAAIELHGWLRRQKDRQVQTYDVLLRELEKLPNPQKLPESDPRRHELTALSGDDIPD